MKTITKILSLLFMSSLFCMTSCEKKETEENTIETEDKKNDGIDTKIFTYAGSFTGNLKIADTTRSVDGTFTINDDAFSLESLMGMMEGTASKQGDDLVISVEDGSGIFAGMSGGGSLEISEFDTHDLLLNGTKSSGSAVELAAVGGKVDIMSVEEANQAWMDARSKSIVYFTHNSTCKANITIGEYTAEGVGHHYEVNGLCNPIYGAWRDGPEDVDNATSTYGTICNSFTILALNGNLETREQCVAAAFVVDKKKEYDYTVHWDNGEVTTGKFTSADGGRRRAICLTNTGRPCTYNDDIDGEQIRITENTLEIDKSNSRYSEDHTNIDFNTTFFVFAADGKSVSIGERGYSSLGHIFLEIPTGIKDGTYLLDNTSQIKLELTHSGDRKFAMTNDFTLISNHNSDTKGRVIIQGTNSTNGEVSITFDRAIVQYNTRGSTPYPNQFIRFSGKIKGYPIR